MPKFSRRSNDRLSTCHPKLQKVFNKVVEDFDCTILVGYRNKADQDAAYESGKSKLKYPQGKHNRKPSLAVDVAPWPIPADWGSKDRNEYEKFKYFAFYVIGVAKGMGITIRWGGDWDMDWDTQDQTFNDLVHFEIIM